MNFAAVIVGAGRGVRMGMELPKCLVRIDNVPLILVSAWVFEKNPDIKETILVVPSGSESEIMRSAEELNFKSIKAVVQGGIRRQDSVMNGLMQVSPNIERVLVHDGARALVSEEIINRITTALLHEQAAFAAIPVSSTLHENIAGYAGKSHDRSKLVAAQTPQGFSRELILEAFKKCRETNRDFTDEVGMVQDLMDINAKIILGDSANFKITGPKDLELAVNLLKERVASMKGETNC